MWDWFVGFIVAGDSNVNIDSRIRSSLAYLREVLDSRAFCWCWFVLHIWLICCCIESWVSHLVKRTRSSQRFLSLGNLFLSQNWKSHLDTFLKFGNLFYCSAIDLWRLESRTAWLLCLVNSWSMGMLNSAAGNNTLKCLKSATSGY
jgi:hypothetical protein